VESGKEVNSRLYGIVAEEEGTSNAAEEEEPGQNAINNVFYGTKSIYPWNLVVPSSATGMGCFGSGGSIGVVRGSTSGKCAFQGWDI
jgi:hypothetical protein